MAKSITKLNLDKQVGRYLAEPIPLNEIREYTINRVAGDIAYLTVVIYVDAERFDAAATEVPSAE